MSSPPRTARLLPISGARDETDELVGRARRGDRSARARLFARHRERVAHQILRMTGEPGIVDDLVQEVFISAFAALPRFRGDATLDTWLYTIAANKVRSFWDARSRRRRREARATRDEPEPPPSPEDGLATKRHRERLYAAMETLPHRYREAFTARAIEGMSLKEASRALGVGVSTLSYRTRRAEKLLCEALGLPWRGES